MGLRAWAKGNWFVCYYEWEKESGLRMSTGENGNTESTWRARWGFRGRKVSDEHDFGFDNTIILEWEHEIKIDKLLFGTNITFIRI